MSDNLRDRIAAALFDELDSDRQDWSGHIDMEALADAVIRELERHKSWWALPSDPWLGAESPDMTDKQQELLGRDDD